MIKAETTSLPYFVNRPVSLLELILQKCKKHVNKNISRYFKEIKP